MGRFTPMLWILGACTTTVEPVPATETCDQIRAALPGVLDAAGTPGAILAFEQPGQPLCVVAAGDSDPVHGVAASTEQLYQIGGPTKTFIASAILLLAADGAFDSGKDHLDDWLPGIVANSDAIRIAHLLSNSSGIPNYLDIVNANPDQYDLVHPVTREQLIAISQTKPPSFAPGSQFQYSNTNWILLGLIIEKVTGQPWGEVVRDRLLVPNQLDHTYIDRLALPAGAELMHSFGPYQGADTDIGELADPSWASSAGSIVSSVEDMAHWTSALYGGRVITGDAYAAMLVPAITISSETGVGYSIGTITKSTAFGDWTGHGGDWAGSRTYLGGIHARGMYVQVATNRIDSDRFAVADVAWQAALGDRLGSLAPFVSR